MPSLNSIKRSSPINGRNERRRRSPSAAADQASVAAKEKNKRHHTEGRSERHRSRSPRSPPATFRHDHYRARSPGFRPYIAPFRSRPPPFYRGGRHPLGSRIAPRGRILYHARPDISPPRDSRRSRSRSRNRGSSQLSPRNHSPIRHRSRSRSSPYRSHDRRSPLPAWPRGRGRGSFFRGGRPRASRGSIIGNFGCPINFKPDYDISPDRAAGDAPADLNEVAEDRDELFSKMMDAKRSENLDEYYRLRDLLNKFDRRNPHLAYRGSGRSIKRKRSSSAARSLADEDAHRTRKKRRSKDEERRISDELEEVDCSETATAHERDELEAEDDNEEEKRVKEEEARRKEERKKRFAESEDKSSSKHRKSIKEDENAPKNEKEYVQDELQEELDYDETTFTEKDTANKRVQEEYQDEDEINFELIENGLENEKDARYEKEEEFYAEEWDMEGAPKTMFTPDFLPILQESLRKGIATALSENSRSQKDKKKRKSSTKKEHRKKRHSREGSNERINDHNISSTVLNGAMHQEVPPSLLQLALTIFIANEVKAELANSSHTNGSTH